MEKLYEDKQLVVCRKPEGVLSQADASGGESMVSMLGGRVFPVHRLDKPVGGVMVFAKTQKSAAILSADVAEHVFEKEYLAVVGGVPSPASGQWTDLLYHDSHKNKTFIVDRMRRGVREAVLQYELLETVGECSLVRVRLLTGRTHQIRAQFAFHGHPLSGDRRYGGLEGAMGLWSRRLSFTHPRTDEAMEFSLAPPDCAPWSAFKTAQSGAGTQGE